ncbi:MAG: YncE family protein [Cytophagaceae bacterium]
MKQTKFFTFIAGAVIILASACHHKPSEEPAPADPLANYNNGTGVFIVNEGGYGHNNSSVSFFNKNNNSVTNDLYGATNGGSSLGDVMQSMTIYNNKAYMVINNSQKVEVTGLSDFKHQATLTGFSSPRYLYVVDVSKAYISDWGADNIKILDLSSNTVTGTITTGAGPEQMIKIGNSVYVANTGGYGDDSTIFVIDATTNLVTDTIVTAIKPCCLKLDKNSKLWVLCTGSYGPSYASTADDTPAKLVMIDPSNNAVVNSVTIGNLGDHPTHFAINKTNDILYYENYGIYKFAITDVTAPTLPFISKSFYGIDVDYNTDIIYGGDAKDFAGKGEIYRYTNAGVLIDNYTVGVLPSGFVFH